MAKRPGELRNLLRGQNIELELKNIFFMQVYWEDKLYGMETFKVQPEESVFISLETCRRIPKSYFQNKWLQPVDIIGANGLDITLEDIYVYLGIANIFEKNEYEEIVIHEKEDIKEFVINCTLQEFKEYINNLPSNELLYMYNLLEELYGTDELTDIKKIKFFEDTVDRPDAITMGK